MTKVLLISFSTLPTMQKYLYNVSDELAGMGHHIWTVGSSTLQIPYQLGPRNTVVRTPASPRPSIGSVHTSIHSLGLVLGLIEQVRPEVIHFVNKHIWNYLLLRRMRSRRIDIKCVHTFHDPIGHAGDSVRKGVILYHRIIQRRLDAIVVHSEVAEAQTRRTLRPNCLVTRVRLGEKRWKDYERIETRATKRALVFGRLNFYKGCSMYPDIFDEVYRLDPEIEITIAGQPSKNLSADLIQAIAACPNVKLDGHYIEEKFLPEYFRDASVVLIPYTSITQSGVILDAYCHSRSILAFHIDGISEFLPDGANTVAPFDTRNYARAVVDLLNDPEACIRAGRVAWEFGREQFSLSAMAAEFAGVYVTLTTGNAG